MLRLRYRPEDFPVDMGRAFSAPAEIAFSWEELCRAAVTVGRRNWADVLQFGTYSVLEALWRLAMVRANLIQAFDGSLRRSGAFRNLDRTEKAAVSYFLGLVLTKLIAEKLFRVPWLLHLDVYRMLLAPQFDGPERPDFVGMDSAGLWIVFESKGRYGGLPKGVLDRAKTQARSIRNVSGVAPVLQVAVGTHFSGGDLRARLRDPDEHEPAAVDLELSPETHMQAYYRPIIDLIDATAPQSERHETASGVFIRTTLSGMDAALSVDERIVRWYRERQPDLFQVLQHLSERSVLREVETLRRRRDTDATDATSRGDDKDRVIWESESLSRLTEVRQIGYDGIAIELGPSWSEEFMRREPRDRVG